MNYYKKDNYIIIRKHTILLWLIYIRLFFGLFIAGILVYILSLYKDTVGTELVNYVFLPIILIYVNIAFIRMILYFIMHYNNLLILHNEHCIVIKSSLISTDNIEILEISKITKIDVFSEGLLSNVFNYGKLVIEQQRDKVREFAFIPEPYKAMKILKDNQQAYNQKTINESNSTK